MVDNEGSALVSVVITTKNRASLLPRAVRSVLDQTYPHLELIVVDDGSDVPVVLPDGDPRARLIRNEVSKGVSESRNAGFRASRGQLLCMLDDDDWYLSGKLEQQANYLREHAEVDLVFSRVCIEDETGARREFLPVDHVHSPEINLFAFNVIHPSSALFRRKVFDRVQFDPRLRKYEDMLFFNRVCFTFQTAFLSADVAIWMQDGRPDQLSRVDYAKNLSNFRIVCQELGDVLKSNPAARRRYFGRLAVQAVRCRRIVEAMGAAAAALGIVPGIRGTRK